MGSRFSEFDESGAKAGHAGRELLIAVLLVALPVIAIAALIVIRGRETEAVVAPSAYSIDPADRKFLNEPYRAGAVAGGINPAAAIDPADRKFFDMSAQAVDKSLTAGELSALRWQAMAEFYEKNGLLTNEVNQPEALTGGLSYWAGVNGAMPRDVTLSEAEMAANSEVEAVPFSTEIYWEMARQHEARQHEARQPELESESGPAMPGQRHQPR
jgi:hypothetical protein